MKNTTLLFAFIAFAAASFLSSCASLQGEFAQRKYYNFPRSKHDVNQVTSAKQSESIIEENVVVKSEDGPTEPAFTASAEEKEGILTKPELSAIYKDKKLTETNTIVSDEQQTEKPAVTLKKSDFKKQNKREPNSSSRSDAGLMMFLAVIASIFFPPLGIYIKDHHTNKWFWITLLLCAAGAGFFFASIVGLWGLFWLAAVVIALMNVFDIL